MTIMARAAANTITILDFDILVLPTPVKWFPETGIAMGG
jgi:hypothetical protein